jgi:hypothetical protein
MKIIIYNEVGDFGEDKDVAAKLRKELINPCVKERKIITIDFSGVRLITQSFAHALISDVLRSGGESSLNYINFHNCAPGVQGIVETVVQYSLETMED